MNKYTVLMAIILTAITAYDAGYIQGLREWHGSLDEKQIVEFWTRL